MNKEEKSSMFDWGKGLTVAIILFICTTLGIVAYIVSLDYYMVTDNHYEKAENYQDHINRVEQTGALQDPIVIEFLKEESIISVQFPSSFSKAKVTGKIELYRPNNPGLDKILALDLDENFIHRVSTKGLAKGKWLVKITWSSDAKEYYKEKSIFI
ncbi:MAG: FixH family protein [Balneolaceae bacterium]|nr:FixH family protein [Balneolaceae bacterium]